MDREGTFMFAAAVAHPGGKWRYFPNSHISHHGAACCDIAYEWLIAFDFAQLNGGDHPVGSALGGRTFGLGRIGTAIHWCDAVDARIIDCGTHAAIAHQLFMAGGVRMFRAQFIQRYCADAAAS